MPEATQRSGSSYMILVAGLLLLIVTAVSVLWITERRKLARVEATWRKRCMELDRTLAMVQQIQAQSAMTPAVARDALTRESTTVGGRDREVLKLPAALGERLGFLQGDLIEVAAELDSSGD